MPRVSRAQQTREYSSRTVDYQPPAMLDAPEPNDPNVVYRWVRVMIGPNDDVRNVSMQFRDGWEPVKEDEHPGFGAPVQHDGRFNGVIGVGDLILCKNTKDRVNARQRYFETQAARQLAAVDNDILKAEHPSMPITRERNTGVIHGQKRTVEFQD